MILRHVWAERAWYTRKVWSRIKIDSGHPVMGWEDQRYVNPQQVVGSWQRAP